MKIYYDFDGGYCIHYADWPRYIGYGKREVFSRFRKQYGLERKHIEFVNEADLPSLMECVRRVTEANRQLAALELERQKLEQQKHTA